MFAYRVRRKLARWFPGLVDEFGRRSGPPGSLNASMAQWLIGAGIAQPSYVAAQGTALGRDGRIYVDRQGDDIWIGGDVVTCVEGTIAF